MIRFIGVKTANFLITKLIIYFESYKSSTILFSKTPQICSAAWWGEKQDYFLRLALIRSLI